MKVRINNRKNFNYLIIILFGVVLSFPLFSGDLNIYFNEGFKTIAEGFEFTKNFSLNDGRILTSFLNYMGTGNTILEAPFIPIILFVGNYFLNSYILTHKIIIFISIILSGYYMHKFSDKLTQNKNISLLSALIYMSTPIHFGQLYINNSLHNSLIFIFVPMTFLGLYKLFNTTEHSFHFAFGVIGLVLTDLKMAAIVVPAIIVYFLINYKNWELEHVRRDFVIDLIAIISITAFFVFPYIQTNIATEYVGSSISKEEFLNNRVSIKSLFVTSENSKVIVQLGIHIIIMLSMSLLSFHKQEESEKKEGLFHFIMMLIYILLSLKIFPWNLFPNWISKMENSYNFLIIATFFECVVCGTNMNHILKKFGVRDIMIISIISLLYVIALKGFIPYSEEIVEISEYDISQIIDYKVLPKKAKKNLEYIKNRSKDVEVINGDAKIYDKNKLLTHYNFKSDTLSKDTIYELPYLYYPGYEIRYDGINLDYFESEHGLIAIKMDPEEGTYFEVNYVGTNLMNFCKVVSFIRVICFCNLCIQKTLNLLNLEIMLKMLYNSSV